MWATRRQFSGWVKELLASHLLVGERIPQAEFGAQAAIAFTRDTAGHERLGVDDLPVLETRLLIRIADLFDEGVLVDRRKRPERCRSAAMTAETCAPMPSLDMKSVMAMGSGSTLPLLMLISTRAKAGAEKTDMRAATASTSRIGENIFMLPGLSAFIAIHWDRSSRQLRSMRHICRQEGW